MLNGRTLTTVSKKMNDMQKGEKEHSLVFG